MSKNFFGLITLGLFLSLGFASCAKDTEYVNPYDDWKTVNEMYLDSIVDVARHAPAGETWKIFKNYKLNVTGFAPDFRASDSVYVKYLPAPSEDVTVGKATPLYTDSADVYYQGFLVNGYRFDGNFTDELNLEIHSPNRFAVNGVIAGWITFFQEMHEGEYVELYIPSEMAYGAMGSQPRIPGYSVLKFKMYLEKIVHPKGLEEYSLKSKVEKEIQ